MVKFEDLQFIGWDSEGINAGQIDEWTRQQHLALIALSTGDYLYDDKGIDLQRRLNFIKKMGREYPHHVHVFFAGSYDFTKFLEGLPIEKIKELHTSRYWVLWRDEWIFKYRPRKELVIAHIKPGVYFNRKKPLRPQCDSFIRFWDVFGFFQSSFINVVKTWLGKDYPDYELITSGKKARLNFTENDRDFMLLYNAAETKALVAVVSLLHAHLKRLGLYIIRWDGAGAVAAAVFKLRRLQTAYYVKRGEKVQLPEPVNEAVRFAYFGGRIESGYMGRHRGEIYNYDINSAYPYAASFLPNINEGEWFHHSEIKDFTRIAYMSPMSVFRVQWHFSKPRLYYPFPFRCLNNSVLFPKIGERWLMHPEITASVFTSHFPDKIRIFEAWEWVPNTTSDRGPSPFSIIKEMYEERQRMIANKDGAEKVLKLGMNSIYGKLCQRLGYNPKTGASPVFHFLLFAAWITSFIRAMIYREVEQSPESVISINTDGIITTKPLDNIIVSQTKKLGGWSMEKALEIVQLQSGVYWIKDENGKWKERTRGIPRMVGTGDSDEEREADRNRLIDERIELIEAAWRNKKPRVYFPAQQFVTTKKAAISDNWFKRLGHWYTIHDSKTGAIGRGLDVQCEGWGKRRLLSPIRPNELTATTASDNVEWNGVIGSNDPNKRDLGEPYDLPWLSLNIPQEFDNDDDLIVP